MNIGDFDLSSGIFVIAEIGNNHEGDFGRAKEMIAAAAEAGANAVKFQTITPEKLVAPDQAARREQLDRFSFSADQFTELASIAAQTGIDFLSTPFDVDGVSWLAPLVNAFKIASGDNNYTALLDRVAATGKPIILSTGAANIEEISASKRQIENRWAQDQKNPGLVLLHCVVSYPTPDGEANLSAIPDLARLGTVVGYSDHTIGIEAAILSIALGARVIEKHFTLDKKLSDFRDHQLSADPKDLAALVGRIKEAERIIGRGGKRIMACEADARESVRRSLHTVRDMTAGDVLGASDIVCLRPATGLPPTAQAEIVGRAIVRNLKAGAPITAQDLD